MKIPFVQLRLAEDIPPIFGDKKEDEIMAAIVEVHDASHISMRCWSDETLSVLVCAGSGVTEVLSCAGDETKVRTFRGEDFDSVFIRRWIDATAQTHGARVLEKDRVIDSILRGLGR